LLDVSVFLLDVSFFLLELSELFFASRFTAGEGVAELWDLFA